jgi:hypothetical protein
MIGTTPLLHTARALSSESCENDAFFLTNKEYHFSINFDVRATHLILFDHMSQIIHPLKTPNLNRINRGI